MVDERRRSGDRQSGETIVRQLTLNPELAPFSNTRLRVESPYDGASLAEAQTLDDQGMERALKRAHELHLAPDQRLDKPKRLAIFEAAVRLFEVNQERLALEAALEGGKPLVDSRVEVARAIEGLRWCIQAVRAETGSVTPMGLGASSRGRSAFTKRSPIGVVLAYSAFNHPVNLIVHQVCSALAAGCPVVIKPSERTPISCHNVVDLLHQAGLPRDWAQIVHTQDLETAERAVASPHVAFFSFIGSADVGWRLRGLLAPGARCALEHGGVAPVVVAKDACLDDLIPRLARGAFYHAGQVCVSVQRIYVHESLIENFAKDLSECAQSYRLGAPDDEATQIGPMISQAALERVHQWVHQSGGTLVCGGTPVAPNSYAPTVVLNPNPSSELCTQEVFGPVVILVPFSDLDEAIEAANALPFTFHSAVCSESIETCLYAAERLAATCVLVNDHTAFRVDWMPFGGHRHAGLGVGGFAHALAEQSVEKQIVIRSRWLEQS